MLRRRLASAVVIIAAVIALMVFDFQLGIDSGFGRPGIVLSVVAILVAVVSCHELVHLAQQHFPKLSLRNHLAISVVTISICSAPVLWKDYPVDCSIGLFGWSMIALTFAVGMTWLLEVISYSGDGKGSSRAACAVLIHTQLILLFGFFIAHRLMFGSNAIGIIALVNLIATVKMSDAAAYFFGRAFGKTKLAPTLSPGKTVEGLLGSVVGAIVGCAIVLYVVAWLLLGYQMHFPIWWVVVYAIVVTIAGVVGDLSESMMKRDAQIKDSSSWLPGLGGVLDITDSLVLAAPISYFLWILLK